MAELLVRVHDKTNPDFYKNTKCTKRGDVISVQPNGWGWGGDELSLPFWRIFKIPDMSVSEALAFTSSEEETSPSNPSKTLQRRAFKLDVDDPRLPQDVRAYIDDDSRIRPSLVVPLSLTAVRSLKKARLRINDPEVFGPNPNIF